MSVHYTRRIFARALVPVCALLLLWSGLALAEDVAKARAFNAKAIKAYEDGKFLDAIDFWLQACEFASVEQLIKLDKNLGLALHKLDRLPEAWYYLTRYMQRVDKTDAGVAEKIRELEIQLRKLNVKVTIDSHPSGATAFLPPGDRMHQVKTPFSWWLPPGEYVVEVKMDGYSDAKQTLRIDIGGKENFLVPLQVAPLTGSVRLTGDAEGSNVRVNGKNMGPLPYIADLMPDHYVFEVFYADGQKWQAEADVRAGETVELKVVVGKTVVNPIDKPLVKKEKPRRKPVWQWALFGSGLAIAVAGGIVLGVGIGKVNEADDDMAAAQKAENGEDYNLFLDDWTSGRDTAYAGYALLGVGGGVLVIGAVGLIAHAAAGSKDGRVSLLPSLGPGHAGLSFSLDF
jgi:hypothetical protein